jgi:hypothetical protein
LTHCYVVDKVHLVGRNNDFGFGFNKSYCYVVDKVHLVGSKIYSYSIKRGFWLGFI